MSSKLSARRQFLKDSAALAGLASGVCTSAAAQMSQFPEGHPPQMQPPKIQRAKMTRI